MSENGNSPLGCRREDCDDDVPHLHTNRLMVPVWVERGCTVVNPCRGIYLIYSPDQELHIAGTEREARAMCKEFGVRQLTFDDLDDVPL